MGEREQDREGEIRFICGRKTVGERRGQMKREREREGEEEREQDRDGEIR